MPFVSSLTLILMVTLLPFTVLAGNPESSLDYRMGDNVAAQREFKSDVPIGPVSPFFLSLLAQAGDGVLQDSTESLRLMRMAAETGDPRAQYFLGTFYYQGVGTPDDHTTAGVWFKKSAENGYADAQLAYGMLLLSGDSVVLDKGQAVEWLDKAARQDNKRAREVLRELLTYRGQPPLATPMTEAALSIFQTEKQRNENQLRLEGKGVILDQGIFGLKFSLPRLYDAYAPQNHTVTYPIWEHIHGGTFDIIIRPPK